LREVHEETGINPAHLRPHSLFTDDHGDWRYDTVIASAHSEISADSLNGESQEMRWVALSEIQMLDLHPSFSKTWFDLRQLLDDVITPI
jgi:8-oxo-dGTP pyrophosphatase MutT (NUDIX family)